VKKILIIEDDPVTRTIYDHFLKTHGYATVTAKDGTEGLEQLAAISPDAIVLDLMMPKLSGVEVLKRLRVQDAYRNLPVIVLSNACVPTLVEQAVQAGANHVIDKSKNTPAAVVALLESMFAAATKHGSQAPG
jgi:CheY-like chemotaxis protein